MSRCLAVEIQAPSRSRRGKPNTLSFPILANASERTVSSISRKLLISC